MNNKEFKQVVKSAKVDLKQEVSSISFWVNVISKSAQSGDCRKAVLHVLDSKKLLPANELKKALLERALSGYKFYDANNTILVCKKKFEKDANGQVVRMDDKPVVSETWYEKKESFSFLSVWTAIFSPAKETQIVPTDLIK